MSKIDLKDTMQAAIAAGASVVANDPTNNVTRDDIGTLTTEAIKVAAPVIQEAQARYDYATSNENPFASWGNNAAALAGVSGIYNMVEALWDGFQPADDKSAVITGIMSILAAVGFLIGRYRKKPIGQ